LRPLRSLLALTLLSLFLAACDSDLAVVHGLSEMEANEILVVLDDQGISGQKRVEEGRIVTWNVVVPGNRAKDAMRMLVANRLPKPRSFGLKEVYPAGSGGLIPTKTEEKAKFLMAMQGEIEGMLKALPGIQEARVQVVVPEKDVIRDVDTPPPPATAAVTVVYNPDDGKKPIEEERLQKLVANAIEGLKPQNVQVFMKENRPPLMLGRSSSDAALAPMAGEQVLSIRVVDKKAGVRAMLVIGGLGALAVLALVLGIAGVARSITLKSKLSKAEAESQALRRARRDG
jgi:type III secretion protein J